MFRVARNAGSYRASIGSRRGVHCAGCDDRIRARFMFRVARDAGSYISKGLIADEACELLQRFAPDVRYRGVAFRVAGHEQQERAFGQRAIEYIV